jgi:uncharacterized RDD family membrane protein YckC
MASAGESAAPVMLLLVYAAAFGLEIMYNTIFVGAMGATPGKMALKVRVVNADGSKVSYGKAFGRAVAEYVSILTLLIGYIMVAFDDEKRALHDRICGTRVIKKPS